MPIKPLLAPPYLVTAMIVGSLGVVSPAGAQGSKEITVTTKDGVNLGVTYLPSDHQVLAGPDTQLQG